MTKLIADSKHCIGVDLDGNGTQWFKPKDDITPKETAQCLAIMSLAASGGRWVTNWRDYVSREALSLKNLDTMIGLAIWRM